MESRRDDDPTIKRKSSEEDSAKNSRNEEEKIQAIINSLPDDVGPSKPQRMEDYAYTAKDPSIIFDEKKKVEVKSKKPSPSRASLNDPVLGFDGKMEESDRTTSFEIINQANDKHHPERATSFRISIPEKEFENLEEKDFVEIDIDGKGGPLQLTVNKRPYNKTLNGKFIGGIDADAFAYILGFLDDQSLMTMMHVSKEFNTFIKKLTLSIEVVEKDVATQEEREITIKGSYEKLIPFLKLNARIRKTKTDIESIENSVLFDPRMVTIGSNVSSVISGVISSAGTGAGIGAGVRQEDVSIVLASIIAAMGAIVTFEAVRRMTLFGITKACNKRKVTLQDRLVDKNAELTVLKDNLANTVADFKKPEQETGEDEDKKLVLGHWKRAS